MCFRVLHLRRSLTLTEKRGLGVEMNPVLMGTLSVASPLVAVGIYKLQARLERWDAQRHAED